MKIRFIFTLLFNLVINLLINYHNIFSNDRDYLFKFKLSIFLDKKSIRLYNRFFHNFRVNKKYYRNINHIS